MFNMPSAKDSSSLENETMEKSAMNQNGSNSDQIGESSTSENSVSKVQPTAGSGTEDAVSSSLDSAKRAVLERHASEQKQLAKEYEKKKSFIKRKDKTGRQRLKEEEDADRSSQAARHMAECEAAGITAAESESFASASQLAASVAGLSVSSGGRKESRAARRRRVRAEEDAASESRVAEARANLGVSERAEEMAAIQRRLNGQQLRVHPIAPDGHCLYKAVAHQMELAGADRFPVAAAVPALRAAAADHMLANVDDFIMFVSSAHGDRERFRRYCEDLRAKAVWGGQVEIRALAEILKATIEVYVPYMDALRMGEGDAEQQPVLRVSYHQKYYGLGEHYNSVVPTSSAP